MFSKLQLYTVVGKLGTIIFMTRTVNKISTIIIPEYG